MIEAITASAITLWLVTGGLLLLLFIAAVNDSFTAAFWFTVIGVALLQFATVANPFGWIAGNPWLAAGIAAGYFPVGVGWSVFRWWKYLQRRAAELRRQKGSFNPRWDGDTWEKYVNEYLPKPSDHKDEILLRITYWPFSALAYFCIDFLREVGEWIYARISGIYSAMTERVKETLK